jgi:hypothetical protein
VDLFTTTFEPWDKNSGESRWVWFQRKSIELNRIVKLMKKEKKEAEESNYDTSVDLYVHNREKHFILLVKIATNIVGTFMGAFNAYEIQQLKSKFQEMSNMHNMLVRVTQQHDVDIPQMKESLASIVDVIKPLWGPLML